MKKYTLQLFLLINCKLLSLSSNKFECPQNPREAPIRGATPLVYLLKLFEIRCFGFSTTLLQVSESADCKNSIATKKSLKIVFF